MKKTLAILLLIASQITYSFQLPSKPKSCPEVISLNTFTMNDIHDDGMYGWSIYKIDQYATQNYWVTWMLFEDGRTQLQVKSEAFNQFKKAMTGLQFKLGPIYNGALGGWVCMYHDQTALKVSLLTLDRSN